MVVTEEGIAGARVEIGRHISFRRGSDSHDKCELKCF